MTLEQMKPEQLAIVRAVNGEQRGRLMDMGIIPGAEVRFIRRAPLGSGCQIEVKQSYLVLRNEVAAVVEVQTA